MDALSALTEDENPSEHQGGSEALAAAPDAPNIRSGARGMLELLLHALAVRQYINGEIASVDDDDGWVEDDDDDTMVVMTGSSWSASGCWRTHRRPAIMIPSLIRRHW
jgi:hypothetical protein